jgi:trigger factor
LEVNITEKSNWERTLEVTLARDELLGDIEKKLKEYKKTIKLEGFRKGKVPMPMIRKIFGKEIESIVAEEKIPDIISEINKEHKFSLISPAKVDDFSYSEKDGLSFKAAIEIAPDIELKKYKGLSLEQDVYKVGKEDVEEAMNNLREQQPVMNNVEGAAEAGHHIVADFQKLDEGGHPIIGEKFENRYFELMKDDSDEKDDLTDQLVGVKIGETRNVKITYTTPENQEQTNHYAVDVKEIKEKSLPELDDDFAKDVGEFSSLEALKEDVKKNLEQRFKEEYDQRFEERIIDELIHNNVFDVPEPMIYNYLDYLVDSMQRSQRGNPDKNAMRDQYRGEAIRRIKWMMIREKIVELEDVKIEDSDVDAHIDQLIEGDPKSKMQIKNYYRNEKNREQLKDNLLEQSVFKLLTENAKIKKNNVTRKDLQKKSKIIQ